MEAQVAKFRFLNYEIVKSEIYITDKKTIQQELNITFNKSATDEEGNKHFACTLELAVKDKSENLKINVTIVGNFEYDKVLSNEEKRLFFHVNAPAIIFPYLRAYISTITSLSGITPIILPTINLSQKG